MNIHNIPEEFIVNTDQTGIHLVPTCEAWIWEEKISKHMKIQIMKNKRPVTMVILLAARWFYKVWFQVSILLRILSVLHVKTTVGIIHFLHIIGSL